MEPIDLSRQWESSEDSSLSREAYDISGAHHSAILLPSSSHCLDEDGFDDSDSDSFEEEEEEDDFDERPPPRDMPRFVDLTEDDEVQEVRPLKRQREVPNGTGKEETPEAPQEEERDEDRPYTYRDTTTKVSLLRIMRPR